MNKEIQSKKKQEKSFSGSATAKSHLQVLTRTIIQSQEFEDGLVNRNKEIRGIHIF